jgi:hypothetical protein
MHSTPKDACEPRRGMITHLLVCVLATIAAHNVSHKASKLRVGEFKRFHAHQPRISDKPRNVPII